MTMTQYCRYAMGLALTLAFCVRVSHAQQCLSKTYTTDVDFNEGFINNVDRSTAGVLKANAIPEPLPYLSVANTGSGHIVRIHTATGDVLGKYWSAPEGRRKEPSRTTVDLFGNTWAANRLESDWMAPAGYWGSVVKVGVVVGGTDVGSNGVPGYFAPPFDYCTCIDRDEDGLIRTSTGSDHDLRWHGGGSDGYGGGQTGGPALVEDARDECILVYQRTHATNARHISMNILGQLWVGGYSNKDFDLLDGEDGSILATFNVGRGGYGGLMDGNGVLWSTKEGDDGAGVLRYDTRGTLMLADDWWDYVGLYEAYGTSIDRFGYIWVTQLAMDTVVKLDPFTPYDPENPTGLILESVWTGGASYDRGVAVCWTDDHIWVANSGGGDVSRLRKVSGQWTPNVIDLDAPPYDQEFPSGVAVDSAGKVWVTCRGTDYVRRIDPSLAGGLGDVDLDVYLGDGAWPYNYSDMTGYVALGALKQALWDDVYDSTVAGARWSRIDWNQETCPQPEGTSIRVQARAAESEAEVTKERFRDVSNGQPIFPALTGRHIEVRVILTGHGYDTAFVSPMLCDLTLNRDFGQWVDCDTNGIPDACEFDDCNENCVPDEDDIAFGWSDDCQPNGVPDECDPDCDADGLPDDCTIRQCTGDPSCSDCNRNGIPDGCDIAHGTSTDCDGDGVPDECSGDCNRNLEWDACDIEWGTSDDCQPNGIPDECDLRSGASTDYNTNGVPDECEDCNENGLPDACDFDCGAGHCPPYPACGQFPEDCNNNGILDVCDTDCSGNLVPDDCDSCDEFSGDADRDCDSDLLDFAAFQRCYNNDPLIGVCACEMDMDTNGAVVESDYVAFENGFTGPGEGEPESPGDGFGGGGEGFGASVSGPDFGPEDASDAGPQPTNVNVELRPPGGGAAVTTLAAHTRYEVHYAANDLMAVNYFVMFGVTDSPETGLSAAAQATSGDWAAAPWFAFWDIVADGLEPVQPASMPPGFARYQVTESEYPSAGAEGTEDDVLPTAGPSGLLCTITTGEAGELYLELYLALLDPVTDSCEEAYGLAHFNVIDTADAE